MQVRPGGLAVESEAIEADTFLWAFFAVGTPDRRDRCVSTARGRAAGI